MTDSPEDMIVASIIEAVAEQRLPAGTKLGEQALSELFDCNRANVRRALASLAAQQVVELIPNRGAYVTTPSPDEAREVFQARRAVERTIARNATRHASEDRIADLRRNIVEEREARAAGDRPRELRASRQFHMYIAGLAANRILERFLFELTMRTTLIIGLYGAGGQSSCAEDEHDRIVDALELGDSDRLVALMDEHLRHLEEGLRFDSPARPPSSLRDQILGAVRGAV